MSQMPRSSTYAVSALLIGWLALGLAIKHVRYADPALPSITLAEAALTTYLAERGWQVEERLALSRDDRIGTVIARHVACPEAIAITLLDNGDTSAELFERASTKRVGFAYGGTLFERPPTARLLFITMLASIESAFGLPVTPAFPIVAIAPAGAAGEGRCGTGIIEHWEQLTGGLRRPRES